MNDDEAPDRAPVRFDLAATLRSVGLDSRRLALWAATGLILLSLWFFAWRFAGVLIVGLFVYYVTRPVFRRIHTRVHNRTLAVVVSLLTIALPTLLLVAWTLAVLVQGIADFVGSGTGERLLSIVQPYVDASTELVSVRDAIREVAGDPRRITGEFGPFVSGIAAGLLAALGTLGSVGLRAFIVIVIAFYLLRDDVRIAAWARRTVAHEGSVVETYLVRVDRDVENIFFGNILNALATGLIAVVAYLLLNAVAPDAVAIPQPTLVGVLVGVASLVPAVGIKLVTWPLGFYLVARSALFDPATLWFPAAFFVVSFVVVDYIPDQLLRPYVSGRSLHVGAVMLAYLFGPIFFGWYGIFLGPFLLAVVFEFGRVVFPWLTGAEPPPKSERAVEPGDERPAPEEEGAGPADGGTAPARDAGNADVDRSDGDATGDVDEAPEG